MFLLRCELLHACYCAGLPREQVASRNSYVVTRLLFSKFCREGAARAARAFGGEEGYQMEGRGKSGFLGCVWAVFMGVLTS